MLLPLTGDWTALARAIERHAIPAIVTQTRLGTMRPAARLTEIAARDYGLRFLLAFGTETPDGFVDLETPDAGDAAPLRRLAASDPFSGRRRHCSPRRRRSSRRPVCAPTIDSSHCSHPTT